MMKHVGVFMLVGSICAMALLQGCGGDTLMPSQDNGVGVEESTIEGVVVTGDAAVGSVGTLQETETPVVGAQVRLMLGNQELGRSPLIADRSVEKARLTDYSVGCMGRKE